jgi:AAA+ ATPase superfamily predicted ATPase
MVNASERLGSEVFSLVNKEQYFVIHAARQTGKTTLLKELNRQLNAEGKHYSLYCSLEVLQGIAEAKEGIPAIIGSISSALNNFQLPNSLDFAKNANYNNFANVLQDELTVYCRSLDKPLVIFFDEADCLSDSTLISFLRQLRSGYINRPDIPFAHSIALVGMRNIRDYKARVRENQETLGTASPFNIISKAMNLRNFTKEEVAMLYSQHTKETGQVFEQDAIELAFERTNGQPWLVNAIANECVEDILKEDYSKNVTAAMVSQAVNTIILRRDVHIDSLLSKLSEDRIKKIIEPMLLGDRGKINRDSDDFLYAKDLGLIRNDRNKIEPANPIYAEVIVRTLSWNTQAELTENGSPYQMPRYFKNSKIDMDYLLKDFQTFWRENGAIWKERYEYKEAAPHLVLMAFLQRVINGGGHILREMAAESGRLDLCVVYDGKKYPIELKILYNSKTEAEGLEQTARYMNSLGCERAWLVIFDRDMEKPWEEKLYMREEVCEGKSVTVVGV